MGVRVAGKFVTLRDMSGDSEIKPEQLQTVRVLGQGAFATVEECTMLAPDGTFGRTVAVKKLKPEILANEEDLAAFVKEVALLRKLNHKSIVEFVGVGSINNSSAAATRSSLFLVQEYMSGGTLKKLVSKQMLAQSSLLFSYRDAFRWMVQVAHGLAYLHSCSPIVVHRDLKLENLLLKGKDSTTSECKIADFGLVACIAPKSRGSHRALDTMDRLSPSAPSAPSAGVISRMLSRAPTKKLSEGPVPRAGDADTARYDKSIRAGMAGLQRMQSRLDLGAARLHFLAVPQSTLVQQDLSGRTGSYMYMAPEMYHQEEYTEKVDVFSFGVIIFELFSRYLTVMAISIQGTEAEIEAYAEKVASGYRPPIPERWPAQLRQLVAACWAQDPSARPTMRYVAEQLQAMSDADMGTSMDVSLKPSCGCVIC